jgi:hypothetical protein
MNIHLECKCTATHKWVPVARFLNSLEAGAAARALSVFGIAYRTVDQRWPDEGELVCLFENGEEIQ